MSALIYVLEDDSDIANLISRTLREDGYRVELFSRRSNFLANLKRKTPDLCLIDLSLPDGDGLSIITEHLRSAGIASIVVTGKGNLTDRVIGLEVGADDYVVKPFEPRELQARVKAVLRRTGGLEAAAAAPRKSIARFDRWEANFSNCTLSDSSGVSTELTGSETRLLQVFVQASGRVLSRGQLMDHLHLHEDEPIDRSVDARISRLRRKLMDDAKSPKLIRTVYGAGYVFSAKVEWV